MFKFQILVRGSNIDEVREICVRSGAGGALNYDCWNYCIPKASYFPTSIQRRAKRIITIPGVLALTIRHMVCRN